MTTEPIDQDESIARLREALHVIGDEYHRDFKHAENTKDPASTYLTCKTERCTRLRELSGFSRCPQCGQTVRPK